MRLRVRDKKCKSNPAKMITSKKRVFRLKCWIVLLAITNILTIITSIYE